MNLLLPEKTNKAFALLLLILCCPAALAFFSKTISVSQQELQQQLDAMGSLKHQDALISVTVKNPVLELTQGSDKLGLRGNVETVLLGSIRADAVLHVRGNVIYKADQGAFFMSNIEIVSMESAQIPPQQIGNVKRISQGLLNQLLQQQPVYVLKEDNMQEQLAKAMLKEVVINDGKLLLTLSVF